MSADGEISVSVNAEGVDDATGDMDGGGGDGGDGGGPGVGTPSGGGGGGGRATKLLGSVVALLSFLKPITDVLGVVSNILEAFVAPLAITLLRLLQPALSLLLKILPPFLTAMESVNDFLDEYGAFFSPLPSLLNFLIENSDMVVSKVQGVIDAIQNFFGDREVGGVVDFARDPAQTLTESATTTQGGEGTAGTERQGLVNIAIQGGLTPFIDTVTKDGSLDFF